MAELKEIQQFETSLLARLNATSLDKTFLRKSSNDILTLKKQGLLIDQVQVKGKPLDRIIINGIIDPQFWVKFRDLKIDFKTLEVFPIGIVNPEGFRFRMTL